MNTNDFNSRNTARTESDMLLYPDCFTPVASGCWQLDHDLLRPLFAFMLSGTGYGTCLKTLRSDSCRPAYSAPYDLSGLVHTLFFCVMRLIRLQNGGSVVSDGKKTLLDYLLESLLDMGPGEKRALSPSDDSEAHAEAMLSVLNALSFLIDRRYSTVKSTSGLNLTAGQISDLVMVELEAAADYAVSDLTAAKDTGLNYGDSMILDGQVLDVYDRSDSAAPVIAGLRDMICTVPDESGGGRRNLALFVISSVLLEILSALSPDGGITPGMITGILRYGADCGGCSRCRTGSDVLCVLTEQPYYSSVMSSPLLPCFGNEEYLPPFTAVYCCGTPSVIVPCDSMYCDPAAESSGMDAVPDEDDGGTAPEPDRAEARDEQDEREEQSYGYRTDANDADSEEEYGPENDTMEDGGREEPEDGYELESEKRAGEHGPGASKGIPSETPPAILREPETPAPVKAADDDGYDDDQGFGFSLSTFWDKEDEEGTKNRYY